MTSSSANGVFSRIEAMNKSRAQNNPASGWLLAVRDESAHLHPKRLATPEEWAYVMARALLLHALQLWRPDRGHWPAWYVVEVVRDLPRLVERRAEGKAP